MAMTVRVPVIVRVRLSQTYPCYPDLMVLI